MLRDEGDDGRHPSDELPVIVSVNVFQPVGFDFFYGFVVWFMFGVLG